MARPAKYDWDTIGADYKAGMEVTKVCLKHGIEKRALENKIYSAKWVINSEANSIISGLSAVSSKLGILKETNPEIMHAVYDRIKTESEFDVSAGSLVMKIMKGLHSVVDTGKAYEKVNTGMGVQDLEPVDMGGSHYLDVANAAYRAKELLKGKELTSSINVNATAGVQNNTALTMSKDEMIEEAKRRGIPLDFIGL